MSPDLSGLVIGVFFGAFLFMSGLADPDRIIGALKLKDFHVVRVIMVFVLVGMLGTWGLEALGQAHFDIKPAALVSVLVGGALVGIGFGLTGYCPGTGLACAAAGRLDALVSVFGMLAGALAYASLYSAVAVPMDKVANYGEATLPGVTHTSKAIWVLVLGGFGVLVLALSSLKKKCGG